MRSSGSTRTPSRRRGIPLLLLVAGEDHPKACTGRRLLHRGLVRPVVRLESLHPAPVVLDPHAPRALSVADRPAAARGGLLVIDCSWNALGRRGGLPGMGGPGDRRAVFRRLPLLIAANPQHYGRLTELNTVEALSASLAVLGDPEGAARLLEGFRGGPAFLEVNRARLARYAAAPDHDGILAAERELFGAA